MRLNKKKGITLIEVIITVLIIGISVSSIAALFILGFNKNKSSEDLIRASQLASSAIESIRVLSPDSALLLNNSINDFGTIIGYEKFKTEIHIQPAVSGDSFIFKIDFLVIWQNERGAQKYKLSGAYNLK